MAIIKDIDEGILFFIQNSMQNSILDFLMIITAYISEVGLVWILISFTLIFIKRYRMAGILTLSALVLSVVLSEAILKPIIQRPRPFMDFPDITLLISGPSSYSFPSGHTMSSIAAAFVLISCLKKYYLPIILLACIIIFSRMYLFFHYPTDILAGIVLGLFCGYSVRYVKSRLSI